MPNSHYKPPKGKEVGDTKAENDAVRRQVQEKVSRGERPGTWAEEKAEILDKFAPASKKKRLGENIYKSTSQE